ncbi:hypothetical protein BDW66DRAFT_34149 [Aspergillus desertorum]
MVFFYDYQGYHGTNKVGMGYLLLSGSAVSFFGFALFLFMLFSLIASSYASTAVSQCVALTGSGRADACIYTRIIIHNGYSRSTGAGAVVGVRSDEFGIGLFMFAYIRRT